MNWSGGIAEWVEGDTAFISVVFSWNAQKAYMLCNYYKSQGYKVRCGGQSVYMNPDMFRDFDTSGSVDALEHHNPMATFTSRGCIRNCSFCLVPKLEGKLVELSSWEVKPIICDNNLLACSAKHFDRVIDYLILGKLTRIDFNQGLDARILTEHHAQRFAELPKDTIIRLAWDNTATESLYLSAFEKLKTVGVKPQQIRTYVLIGYKDTPEDALYRLEKVRSQGALPNPMRYQPLDALKKNSYVSELWNKKALADVMRYYSNLKLFRKYSYEQYRIISKDQIPTKQEWTLNLG